MLVTESISMPMTGAGTKLFKFEKLLQSAKLRARSPSIH
jgi:hypothetical protein